MDRRILVVIGNPPYNGVADVAVEEERDLSEAYRWREGLPDDLRTEGQGLNDLYVRFFRMAERSSPELATWTLRASSTHTWIDAPRALAGRSTSC